MCVPRWPVGEVICFIFQWPRRPFGTGEWSGVEYVRVNVMLESRDIEYLRQLEASTGKSRSELIREAVRAYQPPRPRLVDREEVLRLLDSVRIDLPEDPVKMIRQMREGRRQW